MRVVLHRSGREHGKQVMLQWHSFPYWVIPSESAGARSWLDSPVWYRRGAAPVRVTSETHRDNHHIYCCSVCTDAAPVSGVCADASGGRLRDHG